MDAESPLNLEEQLREMRTRLDTMENALRARGLLDAPAAHSGFRPPWRTAPIAATAQTPASPQPITTEPSTVPAFTTTGNAAAGSPAAPPNFAASHAATPSQSLENRIGSQWFNRIGILAVLIGMAWFLKFAIDNQWVGPLGRVIIGLVAGAGIIVWSESFRRKGFAVFSYSLKAIGGGTLYLSLWAAFSLYSLIPSGVAFAAMILVTAFNAFMAWRQDAELLALYAIAGGLGTPLLVSTGENHEVALFVYLLILDLAVLVLTILRPWSRLLVGAFTGTVFFFLGWSLRFYNYAEFATTAFFLVIFFLLFAVAPRLVRRLHPDDAKLSPWDTLAGFVLPAANAILGFLALYIMVDGTSREWSEPWLAVLFAAFYLVMLRMPAAGKLQTNSNPLAALHLSIAVTFLTIAIPLKAHGRWITVGWLVEGAALLWTATRVRSGLLRVLALICLTLGVGALIVINPYASPTAIFNQRFAVFLVGIAAMAFTAWLALQQSKLPEATANEQTTWRQIAGVAVLAVNALILLAVASEIRAYWLLRKAPIDDDWQRLNQIDIYNQFSYSAWFMIFGAVLLLVGFWKRSAFLRWQALVLVAVAIGKVFLVDVGQLSEGFRILSFIGLGALLLGVSFAYQRDWLHLRARNGDQP